MRTFLVFFLVLVALPVSADVITGKVVHVTDGDTVDVLDAHRTVHRVRLAGIDAPEKGQAFGSKAQQHLLALVGGDVVTVEWHKRDKYDRLAGKLVHKDRDMNLAMVRAGFAWWYRAYAKEQSEVDRILYETAEHKARTERTGLWRDPNPMPPWEWRHRPPPPGGYAAACPCGSGKICIGQRGGRFCVRENGAKKYSPKTD